MVCTIQVNGTEDFWQAARKLGVGTDDDLFRAYLRKTRIVPCQDFTLTDKHVEQIEIVWNALEKIFTYITQFSSCLYRIGDPPRLYSVETSVYNVVFSRLSSGEIDSSFLLHLQSHLENKRFAGILKTSIMHLFVESRLYTSDFFAAINYLGCLTQSEQLLERTFILFRIMEIFTFVRCEDSSAPRVHRPLMILVAKMWKNCEWSPIPTLANVERDYLAIKAEYDKQNECVLPLKEISKPPQGWNPQLRDVLQIIQARFYPPYSRNLLTQYQDPDSNNVEMVIEKLLNTCQKHGYSIAFAIRLMIMIQNVQGLLEILKKRGIMAAIEIIHIASFAISNPTFYNCDFLPDSDVACILSKRASEICSMKDKCVVFETLLNLIKEAIEKIFNQAGMDFLSVEKAILSGKKLSTLRQEFLRSDVFKDFTSEKSEKASLEKFFQYLPSLFLRKGNEAWEDFEQVFVCCPDNNKKLLEMALPVKTIQTLDNRSCRVCDLTLCDKVLQVFIKSFKDHPYYLPTAFLPFISEIVGANRLDIVKQLLPSMGFIRIFAFVEWSFFRRFNAVLCWLLQNMEELPSKIRPQILSLIAAKCLGDCSKKMSIYSLKTMSRKGKKLQERVITFNQMQYYVHMSAPKNMGKRQFRQFYQHNKKQIITIVLPVAEALLKDKAPNVLLLAKRLQACFSNTTPLCCDSTHRTTFTFKSDEMTIDLVDQKTAKASISESSKTKDQADKKSQNLFQVDKKSRKQKKRCAKMSLYPKRHLRQKKG